jgi:single-strand DNA-binding protein
MSDTFVTFHGWVGAEVAYREVNGISVANFRVACTPRLKRKGDWIDGETSWYSVTAWRALAENVRDSIRKGDAVIVHGRLRSETWTREDGQSSTRMVVEASFVGHDLARGTSTFTKSTRPERSDGDVHSEIRDMIHRPIDETVRPDSWGDPIGTEPVPDAPVFGPGAAA